MGFYDAFFGSDQSQYTAYAIVAAIIAICITILLTATDIPVSNRLLIVFFVIISLVPSVFLTLFELTCIVTGGTEPNKWWCYAFAWVLAAFIIIYCIFIVIISLISLFTYNNAIDNVTETENKSRLSPEVSNNYAKQIIENDEKQTKQIEKFYNDSMTAMMNEANPPPDDKNEPQEDKIEEFRYSTRTLSQTRTQPPTITQPPTRRAGETTREYTQRQQATTSQGIQKNLAEAEIIRQAEINKIVNHPNNRNATQQSKNDLYARLNSNYKTGTFSFFTDYGSLNSNEEPNPPSNPDLNEPQEDKIEEFGRTKAQYDADQAAAVARLKNRNYDDKLAKAKAAQARSYIRRGSRFTDYGSVNSNEEFDDSNYFSYNDFKQN